jgi:hypothetical protein
MGCQLVQSGLSLFLEFAGRFGSAFSNQFPGKTHSLGDKLAESRSGSPQPLLPSLKRQLAILSHVWE